MDKKPLPDHGYDPLPSPDDAVNPVPNQVYDPLPSPDDMAGVASEFTGFIPALPRDDDELHNYDAMGEFSAQQAVANPTVEPHLSAGIVADGQDAINQLELDRLADEW